MTTFKPVALLAAACLSTVVSGCSKSSGTQVDGSTAQPKVAEIVKKYPEYQQITAQPVFVNPELAMLCVGTSKAQFDAARAKFGPHANTAISIYMNEAATNAFRERRPYPAGAVVVKCKKLLGYRGPDGVWHAETENGVGGMVKRPNGYDPAHGDWEYFYFEQPATVESGRIASCVQCHAAAKTSDYVFGTWLHDNSHN